MRLKHIGRSWWFGYGSLLALQVLVIGLRLGTWDLPNADGAFYFREAKQLTETLDWPVLAWSPLFVGYYALFHLSFQGAFLIYVAHRAATLILVVLLFYTLARRVFHPAVAWVCAAFLPVLFNFESVFVVHVFIVLPLLLIYLVALNQRWYSSLLIAGLTLLLPLTRPEFILAVPVMVVALIGYDWFTGHIRRMVVYQQRLYAALMLVIVIAGGVLAYELFEDSRSFFAFEQHYAVGYGQRNPDWNKAPYVFYEEVTEAAFGDADSYGAAFRANPTAMIEHGLYNLTQIPGAFLAAISPEMRLGNVIGLGLVMVTVLGLAVHLHQRRETRLVWRFWLVAAVLLIPVLISIGVIFPRADYLTPLQVPFFLAFGLALGALLDERRLHLLTAALPVIFIVGIVLAFVFIGVEEQERARLTVVEIIEQAETESDDAVVVAAPAEAICVYTGLNCREIDIGPPSSIDAAPLDYFDQHGVDYALLSDFAVEGFSEVHHDWLFHFREEAYQYGWQYHPESPFILPVYYRQEA